MEKWKAYCMGSEGYKVIIDNEGISATEIKGNLRERLTPIVISMGGDFKTQEANANKIAAVPDMYEALKAIINEARGTDRFADDSITDALCAIRKAEGK